MDAAHRRLSPSPSRRPPALGALAILVALAATACVLPPARDDGGAAYRLGVWPRGLILVPRADPSRALHLWFHEWNLFGAFEPGVRTQGRWDYRARVHDGGRRMTLSGEGIRLEAETDSNGARLTLHVANHTDHDWDTWAAIIPCLHPGSPQAPGKIFRRPRSLSFVNERTVRAAADGTLVPLTGRVLAVDERFHEDVRSAARSAAARGETWAWTTEWPIADTPSSEGFMARPSNDDAWVAGIAWEDVFGAQAHNPWQCLHLAVRVGPLPRGAARVVHGRIYLFAGTPRGALAAWRASTGR